MKFAFVVLHYKDVVMTQRCVASVQKCAAAGDVTVVVDNSHNFPLESTDLLIVRPKEYNPGFSRGMNIGARKAKSLGCDFLTFVNNDAVIGANFRESMAETFSEFGENVAAIGPKVVYLNQPDIVQTSGGYVSRFKMSGISTLEGRKSEGIHGYRFTKFISGCVITVREAPFFEIGGWSESYFFAKEDCELSLCFLRRGYQIGINADTTVLHEADRSHGGGASHSNRDPFHAVNNLLNKLLFARRNFGLLSNLVFRIIMVSYVTLAYPAIWNTMSGKAGKPSKILFCIRLSAVLLSSIPEETVTRESVRRVLEKANWRQDA